MTTISFPMRGLRFPSKQITFYKKQTEKNELVVTPDETEAATERGTAPAGKGLPGGPKGD